MSLRHQYNVVLILDISEFEAQALNGLPNSDSNVCFSELSRLVISSPFATASFSSTLIRKLHANRL